MGYAHQDFARCTLHTVTVQSRSKSKLYNPRHPERALLYQTIVEPRTLPKQWAQPRRVLHTTLTDTLAHNAQSAI